MMFVLTGCSSNDSKINNSKNTTNTLSEIQRNNIYNLSINNHISENTTANDDKKKYLSVSNGYRFKNSIDEVTLCFEEIYIISEWRGIKPHNDYFLIMKASATSNTPNKTGIYYFPFIVSSSNQKEYKSINNTFNYNYEDLDGNTIDIATEINLDYVKKEKGKTSAHNTDYVSGGNGTRYLVFDIPKETAEDSEIYFVFLGTTREIYKDEAPSKNIRFFEYIEKK